MLITGIEPRAVALQLSKSNQFPQSIIEEINTAPNCFERTIKLLSFLESENCSNAHVFAFISALFDIGHHDIVQNIYSTEIHSKAGEFISQRTCYTCVFLVLVHKSNDYL